MDRCESEFVFIKIEKELHSGKNQCRCVKHLAERKPWRQIPAHTVRLNDYNLYVLCHQIIYYTINKKRASFREVQSFLKKILCSQDSVNMRLQWSCDSVNMRLQWFMWERESESIVMWLTMCRCGCGQLVQWLTTTTSMVDMMDWHENDVFFRYSKVERSYAHQRER